MFHKKKKKKKTETAEENTTKHFKLRNLILIFENFLSAPPRLK